MTGPYPYSPELKTPGKPVDFDLSRPGTLVMLKLLVKTHQKQSEAFLPPEGIALSREQIGGVPCYVARPQGDGKLPGLLYCHGGAFYLPVQPATLALACRYACGGLRVVIPEYRLVPEHPAPAAFRDCLTVWRQLSGEHERLLLLGESAGGALAAGLALYIRDRGLGKPLGQLLIYPVLDNRPENYPSMAVWADAAWTNRANASMWAAYLKNPEETLLPYLIPMRAQSLANLPRTYIEPQQIDVLCDEAIAYGRRLEQAGAAVELNLIGGSYHGFDSDLTSPLVRRVLEHRLEIMAEMLKKE